MIASAKVRSVFPVFYTAYLGYLNTGISEALPVLGNNIYTNVWIRLRKKIYLQLSAKNHILNTNF
ncbi:hypothetical protein CQR79_04390 [Aggregatibacter actinomycetemcomitans]|uniref:Uncharacterized protein n=1 Tax=Aggregatibacter actinomycetemcomitans TaxID=714 RepID=A0A2G1DQY2_AGGAC|nr:hypothetical protein CQR80_04280 [Aggregatibacter actinomycetemcomitans]PHO23053.1 hypothetical protein CQR79_04390 [Aggregatibacter actinomycetemcomitans]